MRKKPLNASLLSGFDRFAGSDLPNILILLILSGFAFGAVRGLMGSFLKGCVTCKALTHPTIDGIVLVGFIRSSLVTHHSSLHL